MNQGWLRDPLVLGCTGGVLLSAASVGLYFVLRKKPTADEIEQKRREFLVLRGRIIDGTLLDLMEIAVDGQERRLIFYKYEIAGVSYECSQDVTMLEEPMRMATSTPGWPASVRYDSHNPTNSIVVSETWTGLRYAQVPETAGKRAR
jgi:hypothetical protein